MHFAEIVDARNVGDVRRERDAARPGGVHHPEPPRHDGAQSIRADDDPRTIRVPRPPSRVPRDHATHRAAVVDELLDLHTLANLRARGFSRGA